MKRGDLSIIVAMIALLFALFSVILMFLDTRTLSADLVAFFIFISIALMAMYSMSKQSLKR